MLKTVPVQHQTVRVQHNTEVVLGYQGVCSHLFALPCRSLQDVVNHLGSQGCRLSHKVHRLWPLLLTVVVDILCARL